MAESTAQIDLQSDDISDEAPTANDISTALDTVIEKNEAVNSILDTIGRRLLYIGKDENASQAPTPTDKLRDASKETDDADSERRVLYVGGTFDTISRRWIPKGKKTYETLEREARSGQYAIFCKQEHQSKELLEVEVVGNNLKNLLGRAFEHYPGHWDEEMVFADSFNPLIHNWDKLEQLVLEQTTDLDDILARQDLRMLLLKVKKAKSCEKYFAEREVIQKDKIISFESLWTIFPPGTLVYTTISNQPQALIVSSTKYKRRRSRRIQYPWDIDYDNIQTTTTDFWLFCCSYGNGKETLAVISTKYTRFLRRKL